MPGSVLPYLAAEECQIPVIGTVRAGFGALAFEEDYGTEPASVKDPDSYFYLLVRGDSMEPRIREGDLALVHRQQTLENGELGVLVYGEGEGTLKKFVRRGNAIILQPFNPAYQPQVILGEELGAPACGGQGGGDKGEVVMPGCPGMLLSYRRRCPIKRTLSKWNRKRKFIFCAMARRIITGRGACRGAIDIPLNETGRAQGALCSTAAEEYFI